MRQIGYRNCHIMLGMNDEDVEASFAPSRTTFEVRAG